MPETITRTVSRESASQELFPDDITDTILLSCHLLGKPSSAQLYRLHEDIVSNSRAMRHHLLRLVNKGLLSVIKPIDLNFPSRHMSHIYLDTTRSRRHLEKTHNIPFRRPPELPSRDWRFLRHDATLVDELVSFELTARQKKISFGYESHFDREGKRIFPKLTVTDGDLIHRLRPQPDKTLIINGWRILLEHDCGEETIEIGNIIRDATIARKHLVYDQLNRMGHFDTLGWQRVLSLFIVDGKRGTLQSSRKRIKRCIETLPATVDPKRIFFIDRQTFMAADDDISELHFRRGDGEVMPLPCWR